MKLLLTSDGLTNDVVADALRELVGKKPADTYVAFIPTAAHAEHSDTLPIRDVQRIVDYGYQVDVYDLATVEPTAVASDLQGYDVIFVGGGNAFYLSYWMQKSGLFDALPELLKSKVYAGISAGSMITSRSLCLSSQAVKNKQAFQKKDYDALGPKGESSGTTLGLVDIVFRPHLNRRVFSLDNLSSLKKYTQHIDYPVYALDDNSALQVVGNRIEVVSAGVWKLLP